MSPLKVGRKGHVKAYTILSGFKNISNNFLYYLNPFWNGKNSGFNIILLSEIYFIFNAT